LQALGMSGAQSAVSLAQTVVREAYMLATDDFFWLSGWMYLALIAVVWLARKPFGGAGGAAVAAD
jgi:DHA2 family multidrug resistance protein